MPLGVLIVADELVLDVRQVVLAKLASLPLRLEEIHDTPELLDVLQQLLPVGFHGHQDHGNNVFGKFRSFLQLERPKNVLVVLLRSSKIARDSIAQRPEVPEVNQVHPRPLLYILIVQLLHGNTEMINRILTVAIFEFAEGVPVVCVELLRVDDHRDFVPLRGQVVPLLELVLAGQVDHGVGVLRFQADRLTVRVNGAVHLKMDAMIVALQVPEVRILEVQPRVPVLVRRHRHFWLDLHLVDPLVYRQADEWVLDVPVIIELDLFQYVGLPRARVRGNVLLRELHIIHRRTLLHQGVVLFLLLIFLRGYLVLLGLGLGAGNGARVLIISLPLLLLFLLLWLMLMPTDILLAHHELYYVALLTVEALLLRQSRQLFVVLRANFWTLHAGVKLQVLMLVARQLHPRLVRLSLDNGAEPVPILDVILVILIFHFNLRLGHGLHLEVCIVWLVLQPGDVLQMPVLGIILRVVDRGILLLYVGIAWSGYPELL